MIVENEIKDTQTQTHTHTLESIYMPGSFPKGREKPQLFVSMCTGTF